jgi:hypothetical protein
MQNDLSAGELERLREQWIYYSKKKEFLTISLNESRNSLKSAETDLYNFKQRK